VDTERAARRWAETWERAWPAADVDAIAELYAPDAVYRSHPLRDPVEGSARGYVERQFAREEAVRCRFGAPVASGERAAVEWWASWVEDGRALTLAGATVLRFDARGLVVEHVDYWCEAEGRVEPFPGWAEAARDPP
jgi:nuclear transport factor 2 (NTF2) superfamily protein